jgi:hypothetical protein
MTKKQWILLAVLIALAIVYISAFTNWGKRAVIQISHGTDTKPAGLIRPRAKNSVVTTVNVRFNLDKAYRLTEVKVVRLAEWQTNRSTLPIWHLISDTNSVPTRRFYYGVPIRGMKPEVENIWPQSLETNVTYRAFLTAGSIKGQHDFTAPPR